MNENAPEIEFLLKAVAEKFGGPVASSKDFESLSSKIEENKSGINATRISLKASSIDIGTNKFKTNFGAGTNSPISYFDDAGGSMTENAMGVYTDESVEDLKATAFNMENGRIGYQLVTR